MKLTGHEIKNLQPTRPQTKKGTKKPRKQSNIGVYKSRALTKLAWAFLERTHIGEEFFFTEIQNYCWGHMEVDVSRSAVLGACNNVIEKGLASGHLYLIRKRGPNRSGIYRVLKQIDAPKVKLKSISKDLYHQIDRLLVKGVKLETAVKLLHQVIDESTVTEKGETNV